ncbi:MAG: hypothetical protein HYX21_02280 [Candidatus Yanofskybacteria bacterium]|nr:hypothetical protein [Candidatus Yanofskybacteria bacterium]
MGDKVLGELLAEGVMIGGSGVAVSGGLGTTGIGIVTGVVGFGGCNTGPPACPSGRRAGRVGKEARGPSAGRTGGN